MNRGVFLDVDTLDLGDLDLSQLKATLPEWQFYPLTESGEILSRIAEAEVVISNKVLLDETVLSQAPKLKLICVAATGTNNVDIAAASKLGITVCNVRGYATPSVVEHVFSLLLALMRNIPAYHQRVQEGAWQVSSQFCLLDFPIGELAGKTMGIVGYGELGRAVAKVAKCFGMKILIAQRPGGEIEAGRLPLAEMLPEVDVLSLHCPLTDHTRNLIGEGELALMKSKAILINTARGGIVDDAALAAALQAGKLGGAGIDVMLQEPPISGNPLLNATIPNLIVTPHIAWASREARQRLVGELVLNIQGFLASEIRNQVI
jgi:glycerate dehydrogenase